VHRIPMHLPRAHGLAWDPPGIWVGHSNDYIFQKLDLKTGEVLEHIFINRGVDPDPHGMDMYQGKMYYCDAGIAPGGTDNKSEHAGYICRIDI
jgi:hypothetical protein